MSTEYFEITISDLQYCTKGSVTTDNVVEILTKIGFRGVPYDIISNGTDHYPMMTALFERKNLILKFYNGIFMKWNILL